MKHRSTSLTLPGFWSPILRINFRLSCHCASIRDSFTEHFKNDLLWLITLRGVKVRESLRNRGYIDNPLCASCPGVESIDHCFRACLRVNAVCVFFLPLLSLLLAQLGGSAIPRQRVAGTRQASFPQPNSKNQFNI